MPTLVCHTCGRMVFTTAPLSDLFPEERRCPRCGAFLDPERREGNRRQAIRRQGSASEASPPKGSERRVGERRVTRRRKGDRGPYDG